MGVASVAWTENFRELNANNSKVVKSTDIKFDGHVFIYIPDMTL